VRATIVGCGAVGSLFAANLAQLDDVEVWAFDLDGEHVAAINEHGLRLSGAGDVIAPDDGIVAVGSGAPYALAAARALIRHTSMDAGTLALEAMKIAAQICVYTNDTITVETLGP